LAKPGFPVLDEIAKKYEKTQAQVALNWLISQDNVIAIPKASNVNHVKENVGALGWRLSEEDFNRLQESFSFSSNGL
jgi:diketogulonate reductase-like aldo/keto reductase